MRTSEERGPHTLDCSTDRVEYDHGIQSLGMAPTVCFLRLDSVQLVRSKLSNCFWMSWILSDEGTLLEQFNNVVQLMLLCVGFNIVENLIFRKTGKWILDPVTCELASLFETK